MPGCCPGERRFSASWRDRGSTPTSCLQRGVRLALESERPIAHVAADLGMHPETLRKRVRQAEADQRSATGAADERGARGDQAAAAGELRAAPRERDPEGGVRVFRQGARPRPTEVSRFIDEHRGRFGVEPICRTLGVSASAYYQRAAAAARARGRGRAAARPDPRAARGQLLRLRLPAHVEGAAPRRRAGRRGRVQRLMRAHGDRGAKRRGKPWRTTRPDPQARSAPGSRPARLQRHRARTSSGSPTSPTCAAGRASCSSPSCSTPTAA